jgi:hypothetical protein
MTLTEAQSLNLEAEIYPQPSPDELLKYEPADLGRVLEFDALFNPQLFKHRARKLLGLSAVEAQVLYHTSHGQDFSDMEEGDRWYEINMAGNREINGLQPNPRDVQLYRLSNKCKSEVGSILSTIIDITAATV